jgi:hypothetical protein
MPIYFGLDDVAVKAEQEAIFRFVEPAVDKLSEWKPFIPRRAYRTGDTLAIRGRWPFAADRVGLEIREFAAGDKALFTGRLASKAGEWSASVKLPFPPGLYRGRLTAYKDQAPAASTEFTIHIAPDGLAGRHPRRPAECAEKNREILAVPRPFLQRLCGRLPVIIAVIGIYDMRRYPGLQFSEIGPEVGLIGGDHVKRLADGRIVNRYQLAWVHREIDIFAQRAGGHEPGRAAGRGQYYTGGQYRSEGPHIYYSITSRASV